MMKTQTLGFRVMRVKVSEVFQKVKNKNKILTPKTLKRQSEKTLTANDCHLDHCMSNIYQKKITTF